MNTNYPTINAVELVGTHDIVFITLDTLRYDVAQREFENKTLPFFSAHLTNNGWQRRHSPGNFTYAAHHAFFAGFLPTPDTPGPHERLFALRFHGSETIGHNTAVFDAPDIISGFREAGYYSICIGGVGFFNKQTPLSNVLPSMYDESHWNESLGVGCRVSTQNQVDLAINRLKTISHRQRYFLFINVSAIHQPNCHYLAGETEDSEQTQGAALRYVDSQLGRLFLFCKARAPTMVVVCSDHGTCYGEQGYHGHRLGHRAVWEVPYAEFILNSY